MKCLVLGGTGIIGNNIIRELLNQGHKVTTFSRGVTPAKNLKGLNVERIQGDIFDKQALQMAFQGQDWVFQAAAYYPTNAFQKEYHVKKAREQIANIIFAAKITNVEKIIYTSSLTTIGKPHDGQELADETCSYDLEGKDPHPYFLLKYLVEQDIQEAIEKFKVPIVMVNPTGCFGPHEIKPRRLCLVPQLVAREVPAIFSHKMNVVSIFDVAKGHILAAEKGRVGERYILGGHNTNIVDVVKEICEVAGVKPPKLRIPVRLGLMVSYLDESLKYVFKAQPKFSALGVRFVQYGQHFSINKAQTELGYQVTDMRPCYEQAIQWFKDIGYC